MCDRVVGRYVFKFFSHLLRDYFYFFLLFIAHTKQLGCREVKQLIHHQATKWWSQDGSSVPPIPKSSCCAVMLNRLEPLMLFLILLHAPLSALGY